MLPLAILISTLQDPEPPAERTPAIYRLPAVEGESKFFPKLVKDYHFDSYCIEPKPGPLATKVVKESGLKVKFVPASTIDTKANLAWRNATIDFVNGKISPKAWLTKTEALKATVHFLSSPQTRKLRDETKQESRRAVFAELLLLSWPGRVCFTADDIWRTRYFPGPGRLESWILAMNDFFGPMMYARCRDRILVTQKPQIIRADAKPGMLIFKQSNGKHTMTFYLNNGPVAVELPDLNLDQVTGISKGLDLEGPKPKINPFGIILTDDEE